MDTGATMKRLRKQRGMTQQQLADAIGCTDAAIRNYERNARTLKGEMLAKMADALKVDPGVLVNHKVESARDLLTLVFQMEEDLGLEPVKADGGLAIGMSRSAPDAPKLQMALKAWKEHRDDLFSGKITEADYEAWKAGFRD